MQTTEQETHPSPTHNKALWCNKVTKNYVSATTTVTALNQVSLSLSPGESCAVVGPSGSGKTTLLGLAAGLDLPTSGQIFLANNQISALGEDARAAIRSKSIGFVFQQYQLIASLTALENVSLPLEIANTTSLKAARSKAQDLLEQVGLAQRIHHYPAQLSGGEQQRVALARAFINSPAVLFADEPTGSLDADNAQRALELIIGLTAAHRTAILLVTHDHNLARQMNSTIQLSHGSVVL